MPFTDNDVLSYLGTHEFTPEGASEPTTFRVTRGDYAPVMEQLASNLAKAKVCIFSFPFE